MIRLVSCGGGLRSALCVTTSKRNRVGYTRRGTKLPCVSTVKFFLSHQTMHMTEIGTTFCSTTFVCL